MSGCFSMHERLVERGKLPNWDGVDLSDDALDAMKDALDELGDLGSPRKDLAEQRSAASDVPDVLRRRLSVSGAVHNTALAMNGGRLPDSYTEAAAVYDRAQAEVDSYTAGVA